MKFKGIGNGYGGEIEVEVSINNRKIESIEILRHDETKVISDPAFENIPQNIIKKNSILVPNVSGCSMTSRGIREAIKNALIAAGEDAEKLNEQMIEAETLEKIASNYTVKLKDRAEFDVIIIGSGGAGLSAAISAASKGASVAVIEKSNTLGGNTLVSMGGINIPQNAAQLKKNIVDNTESFYEDIIIGGDTENKVEQVSILVENALDTYNWLKEYVGVEFKEDALIHFGGHKVPRATVFKGKYAIELITKLRTKALEIGVKIYSGVKTKELILENDRVIGVVSVQNENTISTFAKFGVILATGGFSGNIELRKKYAPNLDERYKTTNVSGITGDGHMMCESVGAAFMHMNYIQTFPISNPKTGELSHIGGSRFDGAILVNKDGKRFVEELDRRDIVSEGILNQKDGVAYLLWGQEIESVNNAIKNNLSELARLEKEKLFVKVNSLEEGADYFGIDKQTLLDTVNKYNKFVENKKDEEFNRRGILLPIKEAPFYFQTVAPAVHHTMGGVVINKYNQVLNAENNIISGLYACGEIVGGTHGTNRLGGNAITEVIVFGKRAGEHIVDFTNVF
ncbi:hypothetical protein AN640_07630 [Candidatus Epulonipiscium fishelsonii]|uniref:Uncharacterized protein n=1 Tax=Candidatus Epulonipiscium fishelsonii TaxID=77094 RepID=A0ACC8XFI1_9FIRM|nr:hypothetical protein AN640_07630 [Epulopiscium sp. SCG-D08WGA-EpuloA1]